MQKHLLTLLMLLTILGVINVNAFEVDGIEYHDNFTGWLVISSKTEYKGDIVIPDSVTYDGKTMAVTEIGETAFRENKRITSVTIPGTVTSIREYSFQGCQRLRTVTLNEGLMAIGGSAFQNCPKLESIAIPNSVEKIWELAFADCESLSSAILPDGLTEIPYKLFSMSGLKSCNTPAALQKINPYAFHGTQLESFDFPSGLTEIGSSAFQGTQLTSVTIPNSVKEIGDYAFANCSVLTSVKLPDDLTVLRAYMFEGSGLQSIELPSDLIEIGESVFQGTQLAAVTIPASVEEIWDYAFAYSMGYGGSLKKVECLGSEPAWAADNAFSDPSECILVVPTGAEEAYKAEEPWSLFGKIITPDTKLFTVTVDNKFPDKVYIANAAPGQTTFDVVDGDSFTLRLGFGEGAHYYRPIIKVNGEDMSDRLVDGTITIEHVDCDIVIEIDMILMVRNLYLSYDQNCGMVYVNGMYMENGASTMVSLGEEINISVTVEGMYNYQILVNGEVMGDQSTGGCTFTVENDVDVEVVFSVEKLYSIVANYDLSECIVYVAGMVMDPGMEGTTATEGDTVEVQVVPYISAPYQIIVNGEVVGDQETGTCLITITQNTVIDVVFKKLPEYELTLNYDPALGEVIVNGCPASGTVLFTEGSDIDILFSAFYGSIKTVIVNGVDVTDEVLPGYSYHISGIKENITIDVTFNPVYYLNASYNEGGYITVDGIEYTGYWCAQEGTKAVLGVQSFDGYRVTYVELNGQNITDAILDGGYEITVVSDIFLNVTFEAIPVTLSIVAPEYTIDQIYAQGATPTLRLTAAYGWVISSVTIDGMDITYDITGGYYTLPALTADAELVIVTTPDPTTSGAAMRAPAVKVTGANRTITINGAEEGEIAVVANIDGMVIYSGLGREIDVPVEGVYMVNISGNTYKLRLR